MISAAFNYYIVMYKMEDPGLIIPIIAVHLYWKITTNNSI